MVFVLNVVIEISLISLLSRCVRSVFWRVVDSSLKMIEGCLRGGTVDWLVAGDDKENRDCGDCDWLIWVRNGGGNS